MTPEESSDASLLGWITAGVGLFILPVMNFLPDLLTGLFTVG